jgi:autophagy-related protein 2
VLPLKLHVDQDTLDFITRFFEFKDESALPTSGIVPEPPFLRISVSEYLLMTERVEVFPVNVMLDYKPKKVDYAGLRSGRTTEFMNFFTLEEAEILLRQITIYGVSGYPKLFQKLNDFWMPDIRGTQLLDVLGGINYVRPFANIGGGMKDLILVPLKEYQKDGRILKGTRKGVYTFGKTFANEIVKVGAKMAVGAQKGLEWGEGLIEGRQGTSGGREGVRFDDDEFDSDLESDPRIVTLSPYADQPANIKQGIFPPRHV